MQYWKLGEDEHYPLIIFWNFKGNSGDHDRKQSLSAFINYACLSCVRVVIILSKIHLSISKVKIPSLCSSCHVSVCVSFWSNSHDRVKKQSFKKLDALIKYHICLLSSCWEGKKEINSRKVSDVSLVLQRKFWRRKKIHIYLSVSSGLMLEKFHIEEFHQVSLGALVLWSVIDYYFILRKKFFLSLIAEKYELYTDT